MPADTTYPFPLTVDIDGSPVGIKFVYYDPATNYTRTYSDFFHLRTEHETVAATAQYGGWAKDESGNYVASFTTAPNPHIRSTIEFAIDPVWLAANQDFPYQQVATVFFPYGDKIHWTTLWPADPAGSLGFWEPFGAEVPLDLATHATKMWVLPGVVLPDGSNLNEFLVPMRPRNLAAVRSNGAHVLTWDAPNNADVIQVNGYKVEYKLASATAWQNAGTTANFTKSVTPADYYAEYQYRVTPIYNINQLGPKSATVTLASIDVPPKEVTNPGDGGTGGGGNTGPGGGNGNDGSFAGEDKGDKLCLTKPGGEAIVCAPLPPGAEPGGPITLRRDGDWLLLIYDGAVVITYLLTPEEFPELFESGAWLGFVDLDTFQRVPTPIGGSVGYEPLTGYSYDYLCSYREGPLGLRHPLWRQYGTYFVGDTLLLNADGSYSVEREPLDSDVQAAQTALLGGRGYRLDNATANRVLQAGMGKYLKPVTP